MKVIRYRHYVLMNPPIRTLHILDHSSEYVLSEQQRILTFFERRAQTLVRLSGSSYNTNPMEEYRKQWQNIFCYHLKVCVCILIDDCFKVVEIPLNSKHAQQIFGFHARVRAFLRSCNNESERLISALCFPGAQLHDLKCVSTYRHAYSALSTIQSVQKETQTFK